jgi:tetratricopeptide (TPR) repeat protein
MRRLILLLVCLSLPLIVWAVSSPDIVSQALTKKAHGDFQGALDDFTIAISQNPKNVAAYLGRASIYSLEGNYASAIADDNKAIALDPKNAAAYSNRGNARTYQGDLSGAIADFNKAIALDPRHVHAFINRGSVKNLQKKYTAAIEDYSAAIALDPKSAVAYYDRAGAKRALGDYAGAKADYSEAIKLSPVDVHAYINRAVLEIAQRDWPAATADLNKAASLIPAERQAFIRSYLWIIAAKKNDTEEMPFNLAEAVEAVPNSLSETWGWEIARFLSGKIDERTFFTVASSFQTKKDKGQKAQSLYYAGLVRECKGDMGNAKKYFHQCLNEGNPSLHEYILAKSELKTSGSK